MPTLGAREFDLKRPGVMMCFCVFLFALEVGTLAIAALPRGLVIVSHSCKGMRKGRSNQEGDGWALLEPLA